MKRLDNFPYSNGDPNYWNRWRKNKHYDEVMKVLMRPATSPINRERMYREMLIQSLRLAIRR